MCLGRGPHEEQLFPGPVPAARAGPKKAAVAVAASILTTGYHMLADGTCYQDLGPDHFARRDPARAAAKLANRIRSLGYEVDIRAAA